MQDRGVWTTNPVKWFRMPCVDPVPSPIFAWTPSQIGPPAWTKPGVPYIQNGTFESVGNALLTINSVTTTGPGGGTVVAGWTTPMAAGLVTPITITVTSATYQVYEDTVVISTNSVAGNTARIPIELLIVDTLQEPEELDIRTACKRIVFNNAGNIGGQGGDGGDGGYNLNFFHDVSPFECDTTGNTSGDDDHAGVYLYEASPFVSYISGNDTMLHCYIYDANWLAEDGFKPLVSPVSDSVSSDDYQYGYSGPFCDPDSNIYVEVEIYAPSHPDTCEFIVMKQRFTVKEVAVPGMFLGDFMDWDVPSDSGSRNGSDFDATRKLVWCYGAEYGADTGAIGPNNDCVLADHRFGGYAYGVGYKLPYSGVADSIGDPKAVWTENNGDYVYPENQFVAGQMYELMDSKNGYSTWSSDNPESLYTDLHMVSVFGQYDMEPGDTMAFCKILATVYDDGSGGDNADDLKDIIDKAKVWIANHGICPTPEVPETCCNLPGDANDNEPVNILDITYLINFLYKGGPPPPCGPEGDANGGCVINILDITYLINYLYKGGPAPICGDCPNLE